jgi:phosphatidylserine decarboxylase
MIARPGLRIILPTLLVAILLLTGGLHFESFSLLVVFWIVFIFLLFSIWFFRDPDREIPEDGNLVVAPADGKVVALNAEEDDLVGKATRISIFMNLFSVHVNRFPCSGVVKQIKYYQGQFKAAMKPETSFENERNLVTVESPQIHYRYSQIAGVVARRIIATVKVGDELATGQRCGLIMFGSRVDLILPEKVKVQIKVGDKVKSGLSIIGVIPCD